MLHNDIYDIYSKIREVINPETDTSTLIVHDNEGGCVIIQPDDIQKNWRTLQIMIERHLDDIKDKNSLHTGSAVSALKSLFEETCEKWIKENY